MAHEIIRIKREDISKLDSSSFIDLERVEKDLLTDTVVYVAFEDGEPAGIITLEPVGSIYRTSYFFVAEDFRNKGIGKDLIESVRSYDPKIYINDEMQGYSTMLSAFGNMGFEKIREVSVYEFDRNEDTIRACMEMMKKTGLDVMDMLRRHGYQISKMKMTQTEIIEKLGEEIGAGYDEALNPFNVKDLDLDWSYIVSKDDFPVSFIVCVVKGDTIRIEQLCAHEEYKRHGAAMLAMLTVMERIMVDSDIKHVETAVGSENDEMKHIVDENLNGLITGVRESKVYALV